MPEDKKSSQNRKNSKSVNSPASKKPKRNSNNKKKYLQKNLNKFTDQNWIVPEKRKNQYLKNNYINTHFKLPDNGAVSQKLLGIISKKPKKNKILIVSNNDLILDNVKLELSTLNNYKIYHSSNYNSQLENLVKNIEDFEKVNGHLHNNYSVKRFTNVKSLSQIKDLEILSEKLKYIDNDTAESLNEFLKNYWEFYKILKFSGIDLNLAGKDVISEIKKITNNLNSTKIHINRLNKTLDLLDFNIDNLNEFDIDIISNDPILINEDNLNEFLSALDKYHQFNTSNILPSTYFKEFSKNNVISEILTNFKRYLSVQNDYQLINREILNLKNKFKSYGLFVDNLNQYYEIKDKLQDFDGLEFVENDDYSVLNEKIKGFLRFNCSFKDYLEKCKHDVIINSDYPYLKINNALNSMLHCFNELNIKINSLSDFDNHHHDLKILNEYINFNKTSTVTNEETFNEYSFVLYDNLRDICNDLLNKIVEMDNSELDYILYNITTLSKIIDKMGINVKSIQEIKDSFTIISNMENDFSDKIFTVRTEFYLKNEKSSIDNDLDNLKNSLDYLLNIFEDKSDLKRISLENLSQRFNNQFRSGFLKSNLQSFINSNDNIAEIHDNYGDIIQNASDLADINGDHEIKEKLNRISEELKYISQAHADKNYSLNQRIIDSIASYKQSVNKKFKKLIYMGIFSKDFNQNEVEKHLSSLNMNSMTVREFIMNNNLYDTDFKDVIDNNNDILLNNADAERIIENSDIYNFYDVCKQFGKQNHDYEPVKEILDLSLNLKIKEYNEFSDFNLFDLKVFSSDLNRNLAFTDLINDGIIGRNYDLSEYNINELDSKINFINQKLNDLKVDNTLLNNLSLISIEDTENIEEKLIEIEKTLENDTTDMDELIKNCKISLDMLLNLCRQHYIEFETGTHKFNSSDCALNLDKIRLDFDNCVELFELEKEINSYSQILENNLFNLWEGPQNDFDIIKNKLEMDREFTRQYNRGVYTQKSIDNLSQISYSGLELIDKLKNMDDLNLKSSYVTFYKNKDILIPEIDRLNKLKTDNLDSFLDIFSNISKYYKSKEITDCIALLEYNIKHKDSIELINQYLTSLKSRYFIIYKKFFNGDKFNMPIEEIILKLENHFKYTDLVDSGIINENYLKIIQSDFDEFITSVSLLIGLKEKILADYKDLFKENNVSFKKIKNSFTDLTDANLVLINFDTFRNDFNNDYEGHFDFAYAVEDKDLSDEDKLHLFLVSNHKISIFKSTEDKNE